PSPPPQESGWRSQQLRVDAPAVFGALPALQELLVVCKYSNRVKARWWRPPSAAERMAARMPTWPPGAAAAAAAFSLPSALGPSTSAVSSPPAPASSSSSRPDPGGAGGGDAVMQDVRRAPSRHAQQQQQPQQDQAGGPAAAQSQPRPLVTQHLRCQMTQNQSMSAELQKALRRITPALQPHVSALTFEIVEETYAEPARGAGPLDLSALPGLKSLTVLSGAEDALANSKLDIVGAAALETLVVFDVSCGCWCYNKPGHGIPPRLLSSPPACLRSLTFVGFVVNQCQNLHALSLLTCLEELRLEQPDPDTLAAVSGELLLTWLPTSLRSLKLHSVILPPCGVTAATAAAAAAGPAAPPLRPAGLAAAATAAAAVGGAGATELLYGLAPAAPLPRLTELYLSKCKVPSLGVLGVCPQLTSLGIINCLSCSGLLPAAAALPALRNLALIHTLSLEQELGTGGINGFGGG
ncbi:hypothetical protein TSOC_014907, partial [Tetrabaena socialis]